MRLNFDLFSNVFLVGRMHIVAAVVPLTFGLRLVPGMKKYKLLRFFFFKLENHYGVGIDEKIPNDTLDCDVSLFVF